jgi:hypothetical protein
MGRKRRGVKSKAHKSITAGKGDGKEGHQIIRISRECEVKGQHMSSTIAEEATGND